MYQTASFSPAQLASVSKELQQEVTEFKQDTNNFTLDLVGTKGATLKQHGIPPDFLIKDDKKLASIIEKKLAEQAAPANIHTTVPTSADDKKIRLQKAIKALEIVLKRNPDAETQIKLNKALKALSITLNRL